MRLTLALLRKKMPKGKIYIGKHRMIPQVDEMETENLSKRLQVEEQNMFILRHPYLTLNQSWGHGHALGKRKAFIDRMNLVSEKWLPDVTMEERFETLKGTDKWD